MFQTRLKTTLTLFLLAFALATSFLIGSVSKAAAASGPDFSISASPTSQTFERGQTGVYTIHVQALNGFTGTVNLAATGIPNHDAGSFSNTSVTGTGDVQFSLITNANESPAFQATLTITGTSGSLQHSVQIVANVIPVPDFSLLVNTTLQTVKPGSTAVYPIQVSVVPGSGFSGSVNFSATGLPANSTASFTTNPVVVPGSTELDIHTTAQTPVGSFTVTLSGTSGSLNHGSQLTLEVIPPNSDFTISATPKTKTINSADGVTYTVTIGAVNGFNGTVNVTLTGLPPMTDVAFGADAPSTGSGTQTIFLFTSQGVTGTFHITLTGTSGPLQHSVTVTLTMN